MRTRPSSLPVLCVRWRVIPEQFRSGSAPIDNPQERRCRFIRKFVVTSLVIASSMLPVFGQTTTTTTATRTITLPPAGLGSTETAEINIVNVATNSSSGTAASCSGTISFLNPAGPPSVQRRVSPLRPASCLPRTCHSRAPDCLRHAVRFAA